MHFNGQVRQCIRDLGGVHYDVAVSHAGIHFATKMDRDRFAGRHHCNRRPGGRSECCGSSVVRGTTKKVAVIAAVETAGLGAWLNQRDVGIRGVFEHHRRQNAAACVRKRDVPTDDVATRHEGPGTRNAVDE